MNTKQRKKHQILPAQVEIYSQISGSSIFLPTLMKLEILEAFHRIIVIFLSIQFVYVIARAGAKFGDKFHEL